MPRRGEARRATFERLASASVAGAVALALACGPAESPPRAGGAGARGDNLSRAFCEAACARAIRCDGPRARETEACACGQARDGDAPRLLRPEWVRAVTGCLAESACDASIDCEAAAYRAIGAAPLSWPPVVMRCLARADTCGGSSISCRRLAAMTDEARAEASGCFDLRCDDYAACFGRFVASRVAPAVPAWK